MILRLDNVDINSNSGPNGFGRKLVNSILKNNLAEISNREFDVQLSFIQKTNNFNPTVLRLDGIYFDSKKNWKFQNSLIEKSYKESKAIVVQSEFNKDLVTAYFGDHNNINVIRNGTDLDFISKVPTAAIEGIQDKEIWLCASSWRPHKRLSENVRYFLENASKDSVLLIAGENVNIQVDSIDRVFYIGNLSWPDLISVMKRSSTFLHLAWLDHCPNVVVDARACGCKIVCSSSGGTKEIAGPNSIVIKEKDWNFQPIDLYNPPSMDFKNFYENKSISEMNIDLVAKKYMDVCKGIL